MGVLASSSAPLNLAFHAVFSASILVSKHHPDAREDEGQELDCGVGKGSHTARARPVSATRTP